ncbi:hypothetical protein PAEPH01_0498 [Pancytospora epiphaga]|nr:hypothetical protein PAEPH01_0498 [Pancytospora epiphaga]
MLTETSVLHILSFSGEILRTIKVPTTVFAIDFSGKNVLMLEPSRVVEFDLGINAEIKTLGRGTHPTLFVKEEYVFLSFSDSIQVFNRQSLFPIIMVKSSLVPRDIDLIFSRVVVASGNEIYSGNDIVPLPNTIVVANFVIQDTPLLMALTSEGALVFFTINCINEYA